MRRKVRRTGGNLSDTGEWRTSCAAESQVCLPVATRTARPYRPGGFTVLVYRPLSSLSLGGWFHYDVTIASLQYDTQKVGPGRVVGTIFASFFGTHESHDGLCQVTCLGLTAPRHSSPPQDEVCCKILQGQVYFVGRRNHNSNGSHSIQATQSTLLHV